MKGENYWINSDVDHDAIDAHCRGVLEGRPERVYVSFPSIKAGDDRFHTAEIISFVDNRIFAAWRNLPKGNRGAEYAALKQRIVDGLLWRAETGLPGLTALVEYAELSTPLSVEHYTSRPDGLFYGLPATPERYRSCLLGPRTPIDGLLLSGSDAGCLGIVGAMMGGVGAACQVLGSRGFPMIQAALKKGPARSPASPLPAGKSCAVLVAKEPLAPAIWRVDFEIETGVDAWAPGQFARLRVGDFEWRDYSIAALCDGVIRFLISTRTGGYGSQFVFSALPGMRTEVELPLGQYQLRSNQHRKVFVATGTGLAPFLPMFDGLARHGELGRAELLFGCGTSDEDITPRFDPMPARILRCISREPPPPGGFAGRVTDALAALDFAPDATDFYVCGSAAMVADSKTVLEQRGARNVYVEPY